MLNTGWSCSDVLCIALHKHRIVLAGARAGRHVLYAGGGVSIFRGLGGFGGWVGVPRVLKGWACAVGGTIVDWIVDGFAEYQMVVLCMKTEDVSVRAVRFEGSHCLAFQPWTRRFSARCCSAGFACFCDPAACHRRRPVDLLGVHGAACPRSGILRSRGFSLERAAARVCHEAAATVACNVLVRDVNIHHHPPRALR